MHVAAGLAALLAPSGAPAAGSDSRRCRSRAAAASKSSAATSVRPAIASAASLRDDAAARLGPRQRDLDLDIARDQREIGKHRAHRWRAEGIAEQDRSRERWWRSGRKAWGILGEAKYELASSRRVVPAKQFQNVIASERRNPDRSVRRKHRLLRRFASRNDATHSGHAFQSSATRRRPSFALMLSPFCKQRARGMPGAQCTQPGARILVVSMHTSIHSGGPEASGIPHAMALRFAPRSPRGPPLC